MSSSWSVLVDTLLDLHGNSEPPPKYLKYVFAPPMCIF